MCVCIDYATSEHRRRGGRQYVTHTVCSTHTKYRSKSKSSMYILTYTSYKYIILIIEVTYIGCTLIVYNYIRKYSDILEYIFKILFCKLTLEREASLSHLLVSTHC